MKPKISQKKVRESLLSLKLSCGFMISEINLLLARRDDISFEEISNLYGSAECIANDQRVLEHEANPLRKFGEL